MKFYPVSIIRCSGENKREIWEFPFIFAVKWQILVQSMSFAMNWLLIDEKIDAISGELSRVTGSHLENLSAADLVSIIEGLLVAKLDEEDGEE